MTFQSIAKVKACKKAHWCEYCGTRIEIGDPSLKISGVWDGDFYSVRGHVECESFWHVVFKDYGDPYDGMQYNLLEVLSDNADDRVADLKAWEKDFPIAVGRLLSRLDLSEEAA